MNSYHSFTIFLLLCVPNIKAWDTEQLEVFDVVEEVKENFYEMLNITNNANSSEIRTAFRRLSLIWHPDKNKNEDTSVMFRNLVSVYEVLKDAKKRAYYDDVLVNGLPNWKSAMYYYRRVRKMGFLEGFLIVFAICTFGQYLVAWASYFEYKFNQQQTKVKKKKKVQIAEPEIEERPKPSVFNTLPFQIPRGIYLFFTLIPKIIEMRKEQAILLAQQKEYEERERLEMERIERERKEPKPKRRRPVFELPDGPSFDTPKSSSNNTTTNTTTAPPVSGGLWTDDDFELLVQLVKKYPGGTKGRWDIIAEQLCRSVGEVTFMAERVKNNAFKLASQEEEVVEEKVKQKTKGGKHGNVEESNWSQSQQKALEDALSKHPKGSSERWDHVAELVPNKTKEECMLRYKHLVEVVKKQKEQ